jgi:uncharacterized protein YeaO (DUF488 family)
MIHLKRVYEAPADADGFRVLVERLWPRGVTKEQARLDRWLQAVAPSPDLREWYGHDPAKWAQFRKRYLQELRRNPAATALLEILAGHEVVTFVFAAQDPARSSAAVLKEFIEQQRDAD